MEAAEEKWKKVKGQANNQAIIVGKQKQPLLAARNVELMRDRRNQLEEAHTDLDRLIGQTIKKEESQEKKTELEDYRDKLLETYFNLCQVLDDTLCSQLALQQPAKPETPKKSRTISVDKDPLDPRFFQMRSYPDPFEMSTGYQGWATWKDSWAIFRVSSGLADLTTGSGDQEEREARKEALIEKEWAAFWGAMKPSWNQLKPILPADIQAQKRTADCIKKIEAHLDNNTSYRMARRLFGRRTQQEGEPLDDWVADLTNMAERCKFEHRCPHCDKVSSTMDERISEQLITGVEQSALAGKLLELPREATLEDVKQTAHTHEVTKKATSSWTKVKATNNRVAASKGSSYKQESVPSTTNRGSDKQANPKTNYHCSNCKYGPSSHTGGRCPATQMTCFNCGRTGHMKSRCRSQKKTNPTAHPQARTVDLSPFDEEPVKEEESKPLMPARTMAAFSAPTTHVVPTPERLQQVGVQIRPTSRQSNTTFTVQALPDTGSNVDILPAEQLQRMGMARHDLPNWKNPPPAPNTAAGAAQWHTWGTIEATISRDDQITDRHIYVIDGADIPILSKATCMGLGLIPEGWPNETYAQVTARQD